MSLLPSHIPSLFPLHIVPARPKRVSAADEGTGTETAEPFNIYQALLRDTELFYEFTQHLDAEEFVNLYSICRRFHALVNNNFSTCIERNARTTAPEAAAIFPFNCYRSLCQYDPLLTRNEALERERAHQARDVPTLRWLRFVRFRDDTVASIALLMAEAGHALPANIGRVLMKLWFLMDLPDNARRIGTIHNAALWTHNDLLLATLFFLKLDMRLTDPMDGSNRPVLRRLLMAQPTLAVVDLALQRRMLRDMYDFVQLYVEWRLLPSYQPDDLHSPRFDWTVFGLPLASAGSLQFEGRVAAPGRALLLRPDQLVLKEGVRRGLRMNRWYLDLMLWGHIDEHTGENIYPPSVAKRMFEESGATKSQATQQKRATVTYEELRKKRSGNGAKKGNGNGNGNGNRSGNECSQQEA